MKEPFLLEFTFDPMSSMLINLSPSLQGLEPMSDPRPALRARPNPNLNNLVTAMAAGQEPAMGELYDLTSGLVHGVALRMLENPQDAEEVVLDVFMKAWRNASTYSADRGSVIAWLVMMARSVAIDRIRSRNAQPKTLDLASVTVPEPMGSEATPEQAIDQNERRTRIQLALSELPTEQREALILAFFGGLSHAELAERLGQPLGTIKTRIRLGLRRLRSLLGESAAFA